MFEVKCLKCGKVYTVTNVDEMKQLIYATGYDGQVGIACECGNKIEDLSC